MGKRTHSENHSYSFGRATTSKTKIKGTTTVKKERNLTSVKVKVLCQCSICSNNDIEQNDVSPTINGHPVSVLSAAARTVDGPRATTEKSRTASSQPIETLANVMNFIVHRPLDAYLRAARFPTMPLERAELHSPCLGSSRMALKLRMEGRNARVP